MGHEMVRLPPYHCQYNPIELIWAQVKSEVAKKKTASSNCLMLKIGGQRLGILKEIPMVKYKDALQDFKIPNTIIQKLKEIGLSLEFLRGQGYDSGANMSGKYLGVQARILNLQPKATYTHCASHRLTLLKACNVSSIKKLFTTVNKVSNFVRDSPKRFDLFKKKINEILLSSKSVLLVKLCETRWIETREAIIRFSKMLIHIVQFSKDMTINTDGNILSKCKGLHHSILILNLFSKH
ncbi:hypothetical protein QTP88_012269 [Uroleucon formosanum]